MCSFDCSSYMQVPITTNNDAHSRYVSPFLEKNYAGFGTSVVRQKSFNIILPRSDRMGQEGGAEGIAKLRSGFWKAFRARPITIKTRGTIAQWRLLWHLASSRPKDTKRRGNRRSWAQRWGEYFP